MKKNYFILLCALLCGVFSTARAGVTVEAIGDPLTSLSGIKEGDYIAFQEPGGQFLFNYKYNTSATDYVWRPQFNKGDFNATLGKGASEQYVWKVVNLSESEGTIQCQLQSHVGSFIPVLDNSDNKANYCSDEGETFAISAGSQDGTWTIQGFGGQYFSKHSWGHLSGEATSTDFKIYKPTVGEAKQTVKIVITAYNYNSGESVPSLDRTYNLAVGETFTVHNTGYGYSFMSFMNVDTEEYYKVGDVITVTGPASYVMNVLTWPEITFAYYDEDGNPIMDPDTGEHAKYTSIYQPGTTLYTVGGLYGYYVPQEVLDEYVGMLITDDMIGETFEYKITLKPAPWVTVRYVDENGNDIADKYENYGTPGDAIPVAEVAWYTLSAADSSYVYNYESGEGYTIGTESVDIVLHYTSDPLPFQTTTYADDALAADTKWYTIRFHGNLYMNSSLQLVNESYEANQTNTVADEYQWAFVGSLLDGFAIFNKATGIKTLYVDKVQDATVPTMSDNTSLFLLRKNGEGKLSFALSGKNAYGMDIDICLNDYEGKGSVALYGGLWGGSNDAGSHVEFIPVYDIETSVQDIEVDNTPANTAIYDLSGRRVQNVQKGIYIVNGVKVVK